MPKKEIKFGKEITAKVSEKDYEKIKQDARKKGIEVSTLIRLKMGCLNVFRE